MNRVKRCWWGNFRFWTNWRCNASHGARPSRTYSLEDQLGLFLGTKSKIEDGSDLGTSRAEVTSVADFQP